MKLLCSAFVLFAVWGATEGGFFKFEDCTGEYRIANVSKFVVDPDPVNLKKNMSITLDLNVFSNVPEDALLKTRYYKIKNVFGINIDVPIPCLLGKFGSCTLPLCKYLSMFEEQAQPLFPEGTEYGCPLKAGNYGGENIQIPIPDMGSIARFIVSGKYRTELELIWNKKVLACYKVYAHMR